MALPDWNDGSWYTVTLNGRPMPGIWEVTGRCHREIEVNKAKGNDIGELKDNGYKNAPIQLTVLLTEEQWQAWQVELKLIHPRKKGGVRDRLTIEHPALLAMGVTDIYIHEIELPRISDQQVYSQTLNAFEWSPPKAVQKGIGTRKQLSSAQQTFNVVPLQGNEDQLNFFRQNPTYFVHGVGPSPEEMLELYPGTGDINPPAA